MRPSIALVVLSGFLSLGLSGCGQTAALPTLNQTIQVGDDRFQVYVADTAKEQATGLGEIETLQAGEGMVFLFGESAPQTFWMKDVEYPIDIVWIQAGQVVGFVTAQPEAAEVPLAQYQHYRSPGAVDTVLELPAGTVAKQGLAIGDKVTLNPTLDGD